MDRQGGRDDEAEEGEDGPVLGEAGGGRGGRAGTFLAEIEENLESPGEDWPRQDRESHNDGPDDQTSSVIRLVLPDITGSHIFLPDHSEILT